MASQQDHLPATVRSHQSDDDNTLIHAEIVDDVRHFAQESVPNGSDAGAAVSLALAIASWVILPLIGAIAALVLAARSKKRIRDSHGTLYGTGIATAAQVIAVLNIVVVAIVAWGLVSFLRWIF